MYKLNKIHVTYYSILLHIINASTGSQLLSERPTHLVRYLDERNLWAESIWEIPHTHTHNGYRKEEKGQTRWKWRQKLYLFFFSEGEWTSLGGFRNSSCFLISTLFCKYSITKNLSLTVLTSPFGFTLCLLSLFVWLSSNFIRHLPFNFPMILISLGIFKFVSARLRN